MDKPVYRRNGGLDGKKKKERTTFKKDGRKRRLPRCGGVGQRDRGRVGETAFLNLGRIRAERGERSEKKSFRKDAEDG